MTLSVLYSNPTRGVQVTVGSRQSAVPLPTADCYLPTADCFALQRKKRNGHNYRI
jgi:hypothetical protein